MKKNLLGLLVFLGISLSSFYLFPSGLPQVSDFVLLFFSALVLLGAVGVGRFRFPLFFRLFGCFVLWVLISSLSWALIYGSLDFLRAFLFYGYNFAIVLSIYLYIDSVKVGRRVFELAVAVALLVSGVGVFINIGLGGRVTGFFNNPNQLAYFSLLGASLIIILYEFRVPIISVASLALCSAVIGVFSAASLGAMAGLVLVIAGYILGNVRSMRRIIKLSMIFPFALLAMLFVDNFSGGVVANNLENRLNRMDSKVDDMYGERNYDRIIAFPEYWLLGAGEAHRERFYPYDGNEIHSTFGNIFFSYGAIGFSIFLLLLFYVFFKSPLYVVFVVLGPLVYSMTHMGARTTFFWILLMVAWYVFSGKGDCNISVVGEKKRG